jgi:hypothetical protein
MNSSMSRHFLTDHGAGMCHLPQPMTEHVQCTWQKSDCGASQASNNYSCSTCTGASSHILHTYIHIAIHAGMLMTSAPCL